MVGAPWRIVADGGIAFSSADDGHKMERATLIDGEYEARGVLGESPIVGVAVDEQTADLTLQFESGARIDVFNNSIGYEGWNAGYAVNGERWNIIAPGGGDAAFYRSGWAARIAVPMSVSW